MSDGPLRQPIFTILTACHNNAKFLPSYFRSVLNQGDNVEVIFVDDASNDDSYEIAKSYADYRVKVIKNKYRLYCSSSYSVALQHATSRICGVVDADDTLGKDAVNLVFMLYNKYPRIGYIYTQHWWCDENMKKVRLGISSLPPNGSTIVQAALSYKHCFSHWRTFRRALTDDNNFLFPPGLKWAVDKHMGFALEELGIGGFYAHPIYNYRYYKGNMSRTHSSEQKKSWQSLASKYARRRDRDKVKIYPVKKLND